jgi:eisosome component PIL1
MLSPSFYPPHSSLPSCANPTVPQQQLSIWGETGDEDVSDVTDKLGVLLYEIGELEDQYVDRYDQYRVTIKSIRNIEASVQPSRDRKQPVPNPRLP